MEIHLIVVVMLLIVLAFLAFFFLLARQQDIHVEETRQAVERKIDQEWLEQDWLEREQEQAKTDLVEFVTRHERTLLIKERQLTFTDDYGRVDRSAFIRELEYFANKVVTPDIRNMWIKHYDEDATLMMQLWIGIYLSEIANAIPTSCLSYRADMTGVDFELFIAERLSNAGAIVQFTPPTGDQGADLIVEHNGETIVVQCKRSASTVGNKAVQEAHAGRQFYEASQAWVVSDAPFSRQARQLASSLSVRLIHHDRVEAAL